MRWILQLIHFVSVASYNTFRSLIIETPKPAEPMPADRAELFARLHDLQARHAQDTAVRDAEIAAMTDVFTIAQSRAEVLRQTLFQKQQERFCLNIQAGVEEDRLRSAIAGKISVSLQLFLDELDYELEALRHRKPFSTPEVKRDYTLMKKHLWLRTDGPSIERRMRALHQARQRAEAMVLEPLSIEAMNEEILRLRRSLPEITLEEICDTPLPAI